MARPTKKNPKNKVAVVRLTAREKREMEAQAKKLNLNSLSAYIRHLHSSHQLSIENEAPPTKITGKPKLFKRFGKGRIYHGDSLGLLHNSLEPSSVDLVMTSPPFGLLTKKAYGNEDAHKYVEWFRPFARGIKRVLKPEGSLVIDIGGAWKRGIPSRSLYHFELLIDLCEEFGFHLCQEHYWWSPSKLPTPAEWVNIRRIRVKDAVNCIWWLSPTPFPKASNRRVLSPYSKGMEDLLKNGYNAKMRPSGHDISEKFQKNNGGSVPPNLIAIPNTESNGRYSEYCRTNDIKPHPARFPFGLPEYFIRFLTNEDDLVVDPFAGSCVTGEVAEIYNRRWVCCDNSEQYLEGALGRFVHPMDDCRRPQNKAYKIYPPNSLPLNSTKKLPKHGGRVDPRPKR